MELTVPSRNNISAKLVTPPKVISLFCGAGGLDLGFINEGFEVVVAIDYESAAIKTHKKNFPASNSLTGDLTALGPKGVREYVSKFLNPGDRVGIIGGPPCQGFSRSNPSADIEDPRNQLPSLYVKIIKELQQIYCIEFVVFENVLGMKDKKHSAKYLALIKGLKSLKFNIYENVLCALDYGVPQKRERIIVAAIKSVPDKFEFTIPKRNGIATVRDAIGSLSSPVFFNRNLTPSDIPYHPNHWTMKPKSKKFSTHLPVYDTSTRSFRRLDWDKASPTIAFGNREIHVHPSGTRRLSIYEAMLLQGFPTSFVIEGNLSEQVTQVSNAVPPPLAQSVAAALKSVLS